MPDALEPFTLDVDDGARLAAYRLRPGGRARGVVQIAHGMAEHFLRYRRFAGRLAAAGWAVYGADHRGHGASAGVHGLGDFGPRGFAVVVDDMAILTAVARRENPDVPLVLFGHSMGSFASQLYLLDHSRLIDALILSGTADLAPLMAEMAARGGPAGLEAFNAAFEPARTPFDWLSRDAAEVDAYVADPLCGFALSEASMTSVFAEAGGVSRDPRLATARHDLPVLVISGEVDPVVGPGQAYARALVDAWRGRGLTDIEHRIYSGARHELLNETCRDQVTDEVIAWLDRKLGPATP